MNAKDCLKKYGKPKLEKNMVLWRVPNEYRFNNVIPPRIYLNKDLKNPLIIAFELIFIRDLGHLIQSWDGCFNIRRSKGNKDEYSVHAWGVAVDINAKTNGYGKLPQMPLELVSCFIEAGFDWGGLWKTYDGMHFQLRNI